MIWNWVHAGGQGNKSYTCGFCGNKVAPHLGYTAHRAGGIPDIKLFVYICPNCEKPTFFDEGQRQTPSERIGNDVQGITDSNVAALYNQARDCTSLAA